MSSGSLLEELVVHSLNSGESVSFTWDSFKKHQATLSNDEIRRIVEKLNEALERGPLLHYGSRWNEIAGWRSLRESLQDLKKRRQELRDKHLDLKDGVHVCEGSPVGVCQYNEEEDLNWDSCIHCADPYERK